MCNVVGSVEVAVSVLVNEILALALHHLQREVLEVQVLRRTEERGGASEQRQEYWESSQCVLTLGTASA